MPLLSSGILQQQYAVVGLNSQLAFGVFIYLFILVFANLLLELNLQVPFCIFYFDMRSNFQRGWSNGHTFLVFDDLGLFLFWDFFITSWWKLFYFFKCQNLLKKKAAAGAVLAHRHHWRRGRTNNHSELGNKQREKGSKLANSILIESWLVISDKT